MAVVNAKTEMKRMEEQGIDSVMLNNFEEGIEYVMTLDRLYKICDGIYESYEDVCDWLRTCRYSVPYIGTSWLRTMAKYIPIPVPCRDARSVHCC